MSQHDPVTALVPNPPSLIPTPVTTRFAPAPTGYLHLGHIVNAIYVWAWPARLMAVCCCGSRITTGSAAVPHSRRPFSKISSGSGLWREPFVRQSERHSLDERRSASSANVD